MIELLVTMMILMIGLLGLAKLQLRLQLAQFDAYQRSHALVLLNDMANRIAINRSHAIEYITTDPLGTGTNCPSVDTASTQLDRDKSEWCYALQGAGEQLNGNSVGALVAGRGCVEDIGNGSYLITVAWQGMTSVSAPPSSINCGLSLYDSFTEGSPCVNDLCRLVVTSVVRIATLTP